MCWCDKYNVTVNRADNIMICQIGEDWYHEGDWLEISPDCLWQLIETGIKNGTLTKKLITKDIYEIIGPEEKDET